MLTQQSLNPTFFLSHETFKQINLRSISRPQVGKLFDSHHPLLVQQFQRERESSSAGKVGEERREIHARLRRPYLKKHNNNETTFVEITTLRKAAGGSSNFAAAARLGICPETSFVGVGRKNNMGVLLPKNCSSQFRSGKNGEGIDQRGKKSENLSIHVSFWQEARMLSKCTYTNYIYDDTNKMFCCRKTHSYNT